MRGDITFSVAVDSIRFSCNGSMFSSSLMLLSLIVFDCVGNVELRMLSGCFNTVDTAGLDELEPLGMLFVTTIVDFGKYVTDFNGEVDVDFSEID